MDQILSSLHSRLTRLENLSCVHLGVLPRDIEALLEQKQAKWTCIGGDAGTCQQFLDALKAMQRCLYDNVHLFRDVGIQFQNIQWIIGDTYKTDIRIKVPNNLNYLISFFFNVNNDCLKQINIEDNRQKACIYLDKPNNVKVTNDDNTLSLVGEFLLPINIIKLCSLGVPYPPSLKSNQNTWKLNVNGRLRNLSINEKVILQTFQMFLKYGQHLKDEQSYIWSNQANILAVHIQKYVFKHRLEEGSRLGDVTIIYMKDVNMETIAIICIFIINGIRKIWQMDVIQDQQNSRIRITLFTQGEPNNPGILEGKFSMPHGVKGFYETNPDSGG